MMIYLEILLYYNAHTVSNTFNVYQAFNFWKINNLFVVSARFCEIYFILQVLLYTFKATWSFKLWVADYESGWHSISIEVPI